MKITEDVRRKVAREVLLDRMEASRGSLGADVYSYPGDNAGRMGKQPGGKQDQEAEPAKTTAAGTAAGRNQGNNRKRKRTPAAAAGRSRKQKEGR